MSDRIGTIVVEVHIPDGEDYERALNQAAGAVEYGIQGTGFNYHLSTEGRSSRITKSHFTLPVTLPTDSPHGGEIGGGGSPIEDY